MAVSETSSGPEFLLVSDLPEDLSIHWGLSKKRGSAWEVRKLIFNLNKNVFVLFTNSCHLKNIISESTKDRLSGWV